MVRFSLVFSYSAGGGTSLLEVVAADFDGDGNLDIAAADFGTSQGLRVFYGNGDGSLSGPTTFGANGLSELEVKDLDGDGNFDLIGTAGGDLEIFLGNSDGSFQAGVSYQLGTATISSIAIEDFDGDGNFDIVGGVSGFSQIGVVLGNADGSFSVHNTYSTTGLVLDTADVISLGDINSDSNLDVVVSTDSGLEVLTGVGDGTFGAAVTSTGAGTFLAPTTYDASAGAFTLQNADLNW